MNEVLESKINILSEKTVLHGDISFSDITRIYGKITGNIQCEKSTTLILCDSSFIEGNISADIVIVDGYVHGNIESKTMVTLKGNAKVIGNISSPKVKIDHGAFLEGHTFMKKKDSKATLMNFYIINEVTISIIYICTW